MIQCLEKTGMLQAIKRANPYIRRAVNQAFMKFQLPFKNTNNAGGFLLSNV